MWSFCSVLYLDVMPVYQSAVYIFSLHIMGRDLLLCVLCSICVCMCRYCFVQFSSYFSAFNAISAMNGSEVKGRWSEWTGL